MNYWYNRKRQEEIQRGRERIINLARDRMEKNYEETRASELLAAPDDHYKPMRFRLLPHDRKKQFIDNSFFRHIDMDGKLVDRRKPQDLWLELPILSTYVRDMSKSEQEEYYGDEEPEKFYSVYVGGAQLLCNTGAILYKLTEKGIKIPEKEGYNFMLKGMGIGEEEDWIKKHLDPNDRNSHVTYFAQGLPGNLPLFWSEGEYFFDSMNNRLAVPEWIKVFDLERYTKRWNPKMEPVLD